MHDFDITIKMRDIKHLQSNSAKLAQSIKRKLCLEISVKQLMLEQMVL